MPLSGQASASPPGGGRSEMRGNWLVGLFVHLAAAAAIVLVATLWAGRSAWNPRSPATVVALLFAGAYLLAALPLHFSRRGTEPGLARVALYGLAAYGGAFAVIAFVQWRFQAIAGTELPASVALTAMSLGMACLLLLFVARNGVAWQIAVVVPVLLAGLSGHVALKMKPKSPPTREVTYVDTSMYVLKSSSYRRWISDGDTRGGALAPFPGGYLLAAGDGWLYFIQEDGAKAVLQVGKLRYRVPYNPDEFKAGARRVFGDAWLNNSMDKLRIADLLVQERPGGVISLYVSHHFWKAEEACTVVRVSVLEGTVQQILDPSGTLVWRTLYETTPCLTLNTAGGRAIRFGGLQVGGAMSLLGEGELLLTVGDHEFDGFKRAPALPQDPSNSYGKVMLIRQDNGQAELYTLGHRNPQGLYVDAGGTVWVLEHGPRGGDELNRLQRGANFGWPIVTYGTDYRLHDWPLNPVAGRHEGFEKPLYAFVPSIAVSQLAGVSGPLFDRWRGDLLAGSFFGGLVRIRVEDGRVIFAEPIKVTGRIRDVAEGLDGRILIWTDENDLTFLEPAASDAAESLLSQCIVCHTLSEKEKALIAPSLRGIVGRPVASAKDHDYSEAMKGFGGRWSAERLDRFLADPRGTVPGTTMQFEGITDASERRQIIELLELEVDEQRPAR